MMRRVYFLFLAGLLIVILMIGAGLFDPKPVGSATQQIANRALEPTAGSSVFWLAETGTDFSVRARMRTVTATFAVVIGQEDDYKAIAVDPDGYYAIWQETQQRHYLQRWQPWVHLTPTSNGAQQHEVWLDVRDRRVTIRFNRELLDDSILISCRRCQVGIWTTSPGVLLEDFVLFKP